MHEKGIAAGTVPLAVSETVLMKSNESCRIK